jgi:hypothetical protein
MFIVLNCKSEIEPELKPELKPEPKGGALLVYNGNGGIYSADVKIFFDDVEIFSGIINGGETVKNTSNKDIKWTIKYQYLSPGYQTKIGFLSGGETIIYRIGD